MNAATALGRLTVPSSFCALFCALACAPRQGAAPAEVPVAPVGSGSTIPAPVKLPPLTEDQQALSQRLAETVRHLSGDIGERNVERAWNLASATDDLAVMLEKIGFSVRRQGVRAGEDIVQNLEVRIPGGEKGREAIVIGAHFDTAVGSPGADADASGVAAVVELARSLRESKPSRSLWFALFVNGEAPHYGTDRMGALTYAKDAIASGLDVKGMVAIDGIGAYTTAEKSQRSPTGASAPFPSTGDFVAVLAGEKSNTFAEEVYLATRAHATLPVFRGALPAGAEPAFIGDHWAFETVGVPALLVTDTGSLRSPTVRQKADVPQSLDLDRMTRVVSALEAAIRDLSGNGLAGPQTPSQTP